MLFIPPFASMGITRPALDAALVGDVTTGLISYWPFNDNSGTTVVDQKAVRNLTLTDALGWGTNFYTFNGTTQTAAGVNPGAYSFTTQLTAFCWIKGAPTGAVGYIFCMWDSGGTAPGNRMWGLTTAGGANNNGFRAAFSGNGGGAANGQFKDFSGSQTCLDTANWHSVAGRFNAGATAPDLFVDGTKDTSPILTQNDSIASIFAGNAQIQVGALNANSTPSFFFGGAVQRCRIYNTPKTDLDIQAMHALGHA